jgi:hypothetical protein
MLNSFSSRLTSFGIALAVGAAVLLAGPSPAKADGPPPPWIFPVVGTDGVDFAYSDSFGACRGSGCSRGHHGVDIGTYGVRGVPIVAAADGIVRYVNWSSDADDLNPERCCTLAITHANGWETWYIHLNNDTEGTDDGLGWGIAEGILPGVEVSAGQLIGYSGDSGNAESSIVHLHWEVHIDDVVVNPTPHADAALRILAPGVVDVEPPCPDGAVCDSVVTVDSGGSWGLWDAIDWPTEVNSFFYGNPGDIPFMGDWAVTESKHQVCIGSQMGTSTFGTRTPKESPTESSSSETRVTIRSSETSMGTVRIRFRYGEQRRTAST